MGDDLSDFLVSLNAVAADYVVIGGVAVIRLVPYRTTFDIDVLIRPTLANARKVLKAVQAWAQVEPAFSAEDLLSGDVFSFGRLLRVDIHSRVPGATWATVRRRRVRGTFRGVPTWLASLEDLISMKSTDPRPGKDLADLRRLEKLRASTPRRPSRRRR